MWRVGTLDRRRSRSAISDLARVAAILERPEIAATCLTVEPHRRHAGRDARRRRRHTERGLARLYRRWMDGAGRVSSATEFGGRACRSRSRGLHGNVERGQHGLCAVSLLTSGAVEALRRMRARAQTTYLAKLVSGEWSGTITLTEPHQPASDVAHCAAGRRRPPTARTASRGRRFHQLRRA